MSRGRPTDAAKADKRFSQFAAGFLSEPLECVHHGDRSEIIAYSLADGARISIAEIHQRSGLCAEVASEFIVSAVNDRNAREHLMKEMIAALEICLESDGLNWASEHDADLVLRRAKSRG